MKQNTSSRLSVLLAAVGLCTTSQSRADIIAEDHFLVNYPTNAAAGEYTGNGLNTQNPTVGVLRGARGPRLTSLATQWD